MGSAVRIVIRTSVKEPRSDNPFLERLSVACQSLRNDVLKQLLNLLAGAKGGALQNRRKRSLDFGGGNVLPALLIYPGEATTSIGLSTDAPRESAFSRGESSYNSVQYTLHTLLTSKCLQFPFLEQYPTERCNFLCCGRFLVPGILAGRSGLRCSKCPNLSVSFSLPPGSPPRIWDQRYLTPNWNWFLETEWPNMGPECPLILIALQAQDGPLFGKPCQKPFPRQRLAL